MTGLATDPEPLLRRWREGAGPELRERVLSALAGRGGLSELSESLRRLPGRDAIGDLPLDLRGIDLRGACLVGAPLTRARLDHARLDEADLRGADLELAVLVFASLRSATLDRASLVAVNGHAADLSAASLRAADLTSANFSRSSFRRAMLAGASLRSASFAGANLRGADLTGSDRALCDLEGAALAAVRSERRPLARNALAEEALRGGYPSFGQVLTAHLKLLHAPRLPELLDVEAVVETSGRPTLEIAGLLEERNWRMQLLGAVALLCGAPVDARLLQLAWRALGASWVSPQIAVALRLVDGEFDRRAGERLRDGELAPKARGALDVLLHPKAVTPAHPEERSGRELALGWLEAVNSHAPETCRRGWLRSG